MSVQEFVQLIVQIYISILTDGLNSMDQEQ